MVVDPKNLFNSRTRSELRSGCDGGSSFWHGGVGGTCKVSTPILKSECEEEK